MVRSRAMLSVAERCPCVVLGIRTRICAIGVEHVVETMRPLPIEALPDMPPFVLGLSVVRGAPVPVVDVGRLVGCSETRDTTRFVVLRIGDRRVALAVESVLGVQRVDRARFTELPRLLGETSDDLVLSVGRLDDQLLLVLRAATVVPGDVWRAMGPRGNLS
jgi:purine-binding chemotaxis protein CheW